MVGACSGTNRDGTTCSAPPRPGTSWCVWHDPATQSQRAGWSKRGGEARSNTARARKALRGGIGDLADVQAALLAAIGKVEKGELDPGPANAMANLARAVVAVSGAADFDRRLADLERAITQRSAS